MVAGNERDRQDRVKKEHDRRPRDGEQHRNCVVFMASNVSIRLFDIVIKFHNWGCCFYPQMGGLFEDIAEGMKNSKVVVAFVSDEVHFLSTMMTFIPDVLGTSYPPRGLSRP